MVTPARRGKHFLYIEFSLLVAIGCENIRSLITSCSKKEHSGFRMFIWARLNGLKTGFSGLKVDRCHV